MTDDDKVVSLDQHRARRADGKGKKTAPARKAGATAAGDASPSDPGDWNPLPGKLFWLQCPTCQTLEYSELEVPGGRRHTCGTVVTEAPVEVDVRAEFTIADVNLQRIDAIVRYLGEQRERFEEYQRRLQTIARQAVTPYLLEEGKLEELAVAGVDALGLLISPALHEPGARFQEGGNEET